MTDQVPRNWSTNSRARKDYLRRRDGDNCHLCGQPLTFDRHQPSSATEDHLIPRINGGGNHPSNLRLAHKLCNEVRGNLPVEQWRDGAARLRIKSMRRLKHLAGVATPAQADRSQA